MKPNAATAQHGGFNQSGPSSLAPWYAILHFLKKKISFSH
jgi:hypothetical protein